MPDATTVQRIVRAVLGNLPYFRCFRCLSTQAGVLEKAAREAAQLLVSREKFFVAPRACDTCGRTDRVLVSGKAA